MKDFMEINAEKARKMSSSITSEKATIQLQEVLKTISLAAEDGRFECYYYKPLLNNVITELRDNRKFEVTNYSDQREGTSFHIKW